MKYKESLWWQEHHKDFSTEELKILESRSRPLQPAPTVSRAQYKKLKAELSYARKNCKDKRRVKHSPTRAKWAMQMLQCVAEFEKHGLHCVKKEGFYYAPDYRP